MDLSNLGRKPDPDLVADPPPHQAQVEGLPSHHDGAFRGRRRQLDRATVAFTPFCPRVTDLVKVIHQKKRSLMLFEDQILS